MTRARERFSVFAFAAFLLALFVVGLGFAMLYDPRAGGNAVVVSRYLNTLAMLAFLVFDGHLQLISALIATFHSVPIEANVVAAAPKLALALGYDVTAALEDSGLIELE